MNITAFDLAMRFVGLKEVAGPLSHPLILSMLQLDDAWPTDDDTPWCSGFCNYVCWLLRLPRSKSLAARSWLAVGRPVALEDARAGFDVVILRRSDNPLSGHVAFFAGLDILPGDAHVVQLLGGNQGNRVSVLPFHTELVVGVRRLLELEGVV